MRRLFFAVVLGLVATTGIAQAAGPKDYAKGAGKFIEQEFTVNAQSDPAGGDPMGTFRVAVPGEYEAVVEVTCMRTAGLVTGGAIAHIGGDILRSEGLNPVLDGIILTVVDGSVTGDAAGWNFLQNSPPEEACPAVSTLIPLSEGNVTVIDE